MKKRSTKKLSLIRETVSRLQGGALAEEDGIFTWNETSWEDSIILTCAVICDPTMDC